MVRLGKASLTCSIGASFATFQHGAYEAGLLKVARAAGTVTGTVLSEVDPAGLAAFFVVGIVSLLFSWLVLKGGTNLVDLAWG